MVIQDQKPQLHVLQISTLYHLFIWKRKSNPPKKSVQNPGSKYPESLSARGFQNENSAHGQQAKRSKEPKKEDQVLRNLIDFVHQDRYF